MFHEGTRGKNCAQPRRRATPRRSTGRLFVFYSTFRLSPHRFANRLVIALAHLSSPCPLRPRLLFAFRIILSLLVHPCTSSFLTPPTFPRCHHNMLTAAVVIKTRGLSHIAHACGLTPPGHGHLRPHLPKRPQVSTQATYANAM